MVSLRPVMGAMTVTLSACIAQPLPSTAPDTAPVTTAAPATAVTTTSPASPDATAAADRLYGGLGETVDRDAIAELAESGDVRFAWLLTDLMQFIGPGITNDALVNGFQVLTGVVLAGDTSPWSESSNYLIGEDIPAPPGYRQLKGQLYTLVEPRWEPFFEDPSSQIEYRHLAWGGVLPDDRPLGGFDVPCEGGCIPALDDPAVTDAAGGDWYPDDAVVFGVVAGGESRAYPKNIMEVHEMVIDTVGGVRLGIPYCTLCGSAQAYDLESIPEGVEPPLLRTSGLLVRSNKLMYDLNTWSAFDTFTGRALSGPLREADVELEMVSVVTSTWGAWKEAHPQTTIVAADGGIGRTYPEDPLRGRDDDGPIFPIGNVDPRLPVQTQVLGVQHGETFVAFPADEAVAALRAGQAVTFEEIVVELDGNGLKARLSGGDELVTHQAFWFAWSQFHPTTDVWSADLLE